MKDFPNLFVLVFISVFASCTPKKTLEQEVMEIYKDIPQYKERPYYTMQIGGGNCNFEIRVNDMPVWQHLRERGGISTNVPLNAYILESGMQDVSVKIFPRKGETQLTKYAKLGTDWKKKFETLAGVFQKAYEMADKVKNGAGGKMKKSSVPVGFEIMSPAVEANINWKMVTPKKGREVAIEGKLDFKASPLVGAKLIIDLLGAISNLNPAAKIIYVSLNTLVDDLSKYVTFTLEFYGQLDVEFNGLTINSITGADGGETRIKPKMGVKLELELTIEVKREVFGTEIKMGFSTQAEADAYFGGDFKIDADDKGIYVEPVLKFSGLLVKAKMTGYIGKFKRTIKLEDKNGKPIEVVDSEKWPFGKKYLI